MNKKAMTDTLKTIIISLLVFVLVFFSATKLGAFTVKSADLSACQASLLKASVLGSEDKPLSKLNCNDLPDLEIKKSHIISGGRINDDAVKRAINDRIFECWKMVGKGGITPFGKLDGTQTYCLVCSDVVFDKDFIQLAEDQKYNFTKLAYWQTQHSVPGLKTTYFEELYGVAPTSDSVEKTQQAQTPLNFSEQNVIVWTLELSKLNADNPFVWAVLSNPAGVVYVTYRLIAGPQTIATGMNLVPRARVGQQITLPDGTKKDFCTKLVNY